MQLVLGCVGMVVKCGQSEWKMNKAVHDMKRNENSEMDVSCE